MGTLRQDQTDIQDADQIDYDDAASGLGSSEVQSAIDTINDWLSAANGVIKQTISLAISSNGTVITAAVGAAVGTILRFKFSDGLTDVDVTADKTVSLTPGTDTVPQENFIYFLKTDPTTLVNSTSGFPTAEHAPVGRIVVQSAATVLADGVLKQHDYTDHLISTNGQGHLTHVNDWMRSKPATWISAVAPTVTGSGTGTINVGTTSGVVKQLHKHSFPAMSSPSDVWVVNDFTTKYNKITNLGAGITTDSGGTTLNNRWYTLVLWAAISQEGSGESKLFINVPSGSYATLSGAIEDADKTVNFSVPNEFVGVGFLIQKIVLRNNAGTTWTIDTSGNNDLRGLFPNTDAGSTTATATEFSDSQFRIFNNADNTKELAFDVSAITTGTIRTISAPDRDLDLDIPQFSQVGIGKDPASGIELDVLGESIFDGAFTELRGPTSGGTFAFDFTLRFGREDTGGYDESTFFIPRLQSDSLEGLEIIARQNLELASAYVECKTPSSEGISADDTLMFDVTGDSGPNTGFNAVNAAFEYMTVVSNNKDDATSDILALRLANVAAPGTTNHFITMFKSSNTEYAALTGGASGELRLTTDFNIDDAGGLQVQGTKVMGAQGAAVADATDAASAITQLNAWLARARAHGSIAA